MCNTFALSAKLALALASGLASVLNDFQLSNSKKPLLSWKQFQEDLFKCLSCLGKYYLVNAIRSVPIVTLNKPVFFCPKWRIAKVFYKNVAIIL